MNPRPNPGVRCIRCTHFRNDPDFLEAHIQGLNCLSSGRASVRKDDGLCLHNDLYLGANDWCEDFSIGDPRTERNLAAT